MYAYNLIVLKDNKKADKMLEEFERLKKTYPAKGEIESETEIIASIYSFKDKRKEQVNSNVNNI